MTCVSVLELFILFPLLVQTCSSQNDTQEKERTVSLQGMVDKSTAEKHFKAIGKYLKQKNMYADDLESLKKYTSLLETELLTLKNTTKQMSVKVEQLMGSLRAEQEIVKNQTIQIDECKNKIKKYLGDLNDCMGENKLLTEKLKNQTDEIRCKNSEDIRSSIVLIELMFNDLFKVKESRAKQWTRFYQTMQAIVHQKNTTTNDTSEKLKPLLKSTPEKILKDLQTYFNSAEQFGQTVDECFKRLSDDIQAYHQSKPLSDDNITVIMHKALQIIIDAFLSDDQKSTSKLKTIN